MEIEGKLAIITGSTGKLGRPIATGLARAGADCICHYNSNDSAAVRLVEQIESLGRKAVAIKADLTNQNGIDKLTEAIERASLPSILVNSASVFERGPVECVDFACAHRTIELNLTGPIVLSGKFAAIITRNCPDSKKPAAKIINIVDIAAEKPWAGYSLYCASKAGLAAATKSMAKELAPLLSVNAIAPGLIDLPGDFDEKERARQIAMIPMQRPGRAEEIISAVKFIIENDFITGQVISIDGGKTL